MHYQNAIRWILKSQLYYQILMVHSQMVYSSMLLNFKQIEPGYWMEAYCSRLLYLELIDSMINFGVNVVTWLTIKLVQRSNQSQFC